MQKVFKWFTEENESTLTYIHWFANNFEPKYFEGIDRLLFCFIKYCSFLSIVPKRQFLDAYLKIDAKRDIKKYNIKVDTMSSYDYSQTSQLEEAYHVLSNLAGITFDDYLNNAIEDRNFKVDMKEFMSTMQSDNIQQAFLSYYPRLNDGSDVTEVSKSLRQALSDIDKTFDVTKIKNIDYSNKEDDLDMEFVAKTGIPCVDGDIGGIYTGLITSLNAQPGGGKTRMSLVHWVYPVLMAGYDVWFCETEMKKSQIQNILIAYHIIRLYGGKIKIPDSVLNKPKEMSEEQKQIYEAAKIDLFESGNYGKFLYKQNMVVEEMEDELDAVVRGNPNLRLIVIDYMGLIDSNPRDRYHQLEQYEIITEAYKIVRRILLSVKAHAVCINQYNDNGIAAAYAGKPIRSGHIQGGHIVHRHVDYDLDITYTEEEKLAKVRMLSTGKTRGSAGFANVMFDVDMAVSIFRQRIST